MIKLILTGAWVCLVTLGAVYFSVQLGTAPPADPKGEEKAPLELVRGEAVTIPVIADGTVQGYFVGRLSFMVDKKKEEIAQYPLPQYMTDALFDLLAGSDATKLGGKGSFDAEKFRATIKADINKKIGEPLVDQVFIEQLDYLSKDEIRNNAQQGKQNVPVQMVEGEDPTKPAGEAGGEAAPAEAPAH